MARIHEDEREVIRETEPGGPSWTGYAAVKYGFIFLITVAILYFLAVYVLPIF